MKWLDQVKWDSNGLVPAIAQEVGSNDVLMFAFMNREALAKTAELGEAVYFSRSRQRLWHKGEESGHIQKVHELRLDCDNDVVLLKVEQLGHEPGIACHTGRHACFFQLLKVAQLGHEPEDPSIACHTGRHSCFYRKLVGTEWKSVEPVLKDPASTYT